MANLDQRVDQLADAAKGSRETAHARRAQMTTGGATTTKVTVADDIVTRLEQHGVRHVFGIPGMHNLPLYDALGRSHITHVTPRHEQGAGYAADGYSRATGRPGVCVVTSGPGLTNIITPVATAHADSVPLLVISPGMPYALEGGDTGFLHDLKDQHGLMGRVATSIRVHTSQQALAAIDLAFASFRSSRPRPVHIEVPIDRLGAAGCVAFSPARIGLPVPDLDRIHKAAEILAAADSPAIVLGGGAKDAAPQAISLARPLQAPVVTTVNGKGTVPEDDPLSLGASIRLRCVQEFLSGCDVLLVVGSELAESDLWRPPPLEVDGVVIRVDLDPSQLQKNIASALPIHGDAAVTLSRIADCLPIHACRSRNDLTCLRQEILEEAREDGRQYEQLIEVIANSLAPDGIVASDSTMACYYGLVHFLHQRHPRQLLYPTGYATLGYGLPAAIGAKIALPDRQVLCLIGDGGLLFTIQELATAVDQRLALPVIVVANGGYGEIRRAMERLGMAPVGVDLEAPDFGQIARGFGAHGTRAARYTELGELVSQALDREQPTVIVVEEEPR
jgi:acetolactate synthase-1/2/3 large subunit